MSQEIDSRLANLPDAIGLLRGIFAHAPVGIQIYTPDGHSVLTNQAFREMFGSEPPPEYNVLEDEIARETGVLDLIHRAFRGETVHVPAAWYDPRELKQVHVVEGKRVAIESTFFPLFDAAGKLGYVAIVFKDVTVELEAERRARFLAEAGAILVGSLEYRDTCREVARLSVASFAAFCTIDIVDAGAWHRVATEHVDPQKRAIMDALQEGYPPTPTSPQPAARAMRERKPELLVELDEQILAEHTVDETHRELIRQLDLRSHLAVPLEARGRIVGALSFGRSGRQLRFGPEDVRLAMELGRRVASAVESAQLYRGAQEAIRARDEFLSVASHELKTPLTPLQLQIEVLQRFISGDENLRSRLDLAQRQTIRLARLIESLLDVSRISVGKLELEREDVDLSQLVGEVVERFRDEARMDHCVLEWAPGAPLAGRWDRLRLEQVVSNLLANALKYGAGKPVEIALGREGEHAILRVRDHGIGIAEADQQRIFDRFERASSSRHYGGLGLGLYITQQIVVSHGGMISVTSRPGEGAAFTVSLPLGGGP